MDIRIDGIIAIVGNYGSGKTELTINLGINAKQAGLTVCIADLDLINPYFRTREARDLLENYGIEMVLPPEKYLQSDLPVISPKVFGIIRKPSQLTLLDCGGNDSGAAILSTLSNLLEDQAFRVLQVINPFRPQTETIEGCKKVRLEIENAARAKISGIIGNANLIEETTVETIIKGYEFVKDTAIEMDVPLELITIPSELISSIDCSVFSCPVLPFERQLTVPWKIY